MSKDSKLTTLHIDKMDRQVREDERARAYASTDDDSLSDDGPQRDGKTITQPEPSTISIGQIQIKSAGAKVENNEKVKTRNIVFNVKSLRALQSNIGVFSV